MTLVITLDESLATQLETRAAASNLSVEEYARQVLREVAGDGDAHWQAANQRRRQLIRKQFDTGLGGDEEDELERLQHLADRRLDQLDDQTLDDVRRLRQKVDTIIQSSSG